MCLRVFVTAAFFPWFGCYPLFGALAASLWCLPLAVVPWVAAVFIYHDLAPSAAYRGCEALFGESGTRTLDVANACAFACFLLAAWFPALLEAKELSVPPDLEPVAQLAHAANEMFSVEKLIFAGDTRNVERFVYDVFGNMKVCDETTVRLWLASVLLNQDHSKLAQNRAVVESLYGSANAAPECVRRALHAAGNESNPTAHK